MRSTTRLVLATWFVATLVSQDPFRQWDRLRRLDVYHCLLPDWRFFAPSPGIDDYHILMRDFVDKDSQPGPWSEVEFLVDRHWSQAVWHPLRRYEKTVYDATNELIRICAERDPASAYLTVPYVTLLNHVLTRGCHQAEAVRTQFLVAASDGYADEDDPLLLFRSEVHELKPSST